MPQLRKCPNCQVQYWDNFEHDCRNGTNVNTCKVESQSEQVCDWKRNGGYMHTKCKCVSKYYADWKFCPYCGKKIKVIE